MRQDATFIVGGVQSPERLALNRRATPGRQFVFCNGMAYAQRRRLLGARAQAAVSAREYFVRNAAFNDSVYRQIVHPEARVDAA